MIMLGTGFGAVTGAIAGKFSAVGIDDDFIEEVSNTIECFLLDQAYLVSVHFQVTHWHAW